MNRVLKAIALIGVVAVIGGSLSSCGKADAAKKSGGVRKIQVGVINNGYPIAYKDDKGNLTGCDLEAIQLVDKLLPDYEFEYNFLDQPAIYAGLQSGKLQVAMTNSFWTPEREEKYLFPKENLGASVVGLFTRKADSDVKNFKDVSAKKLKLTPILAGDGLYYVVEKYNQENPSAPIKLTATDDVNSFTNAFQWVAEGRSDFGLTPKYYWDALVEKDDGSLHQYKEKLVFTTFTAVKTWTILAKGEDKFADALSGAIKQLKDEGKLVELAKKFHGYNTFEYLDAQAK